MKALVAYLSYSGNTEEVAELIKDQIHHQGITVKYYRIGLDQEVDASKYDLFFIGTFTWVNGSTPDEVKDFVLQIGYKPENVAIFGTGDTQFGGDELFCHAATKLAKFYHSQWKPLKIEQSPRGYQEIIVNQWVKGVLQDVKSIT